METLICNLTSFLRIPLSQFSKAFGLTATPVALLVPGVKPDLIVIDSSDLSILKPKMDYPYLYHLSIYTSSLFVQFH